MCWNFSIVFGEFFFRGFDSETESIDSKHSRLLSKFGFILWIVIWIVGKTKRMSSMEYSSMPPIYNIIFLCV